MFNLKKSRLRSELLAFYFGHPGLEDYIRSLARQLQVDPTNLQRELVRLEKEGLFRSRLSGRQKYYSLNPDYPWLKELKKIVAGTLGAESYLQELANLLGVEFAFIYGSYAKGTDKFNSDIDLLIIGQPDLDQVAALISGVEKKIKREINYRVIGQKEIKKMIHYDNSFITGLLNKHKVFVCGDPKEFTKTYRSRPVKKRKQHRF